VQQLAVLKWSAGVAVTAAAHYTRPAEVENTAVAVQPRQLQLVAAVLLFVSTDSLLAFVW
jgi:hypothetical protein